MLNMCVVQLSYMIHFHLSFFTALLCNGMLSNVAKKWFVSDLNVCLTPPSHRALIQSPGICLGLVGGVIQCAIVWVFFSLMYAFPTIFLSFSLTQLMTSPSLVLYMIYYPPHLKYLAVDVPVPGSSPAHVQTHVRTDAWRTSVVLAWVVFGHM
jgi:hypothetical protein